jgi:hypothetical protein
MRTYIRATIQNMANSEILDMISEGHAPPDQG